MDPRFEVIDSFENAQRDRCVDIFRRPDGTHGFEEWRREPEDPGRWFRARYYSDAVYATPHDACVAARELVAWFDGSRAT